MSRLLPAWAAGDSEGIALPATGLAMPQPGLRAPARHLPRRRAELVVSAGS